MLLLLAGCKASTPVVDALVCLQPAQLIKGSSGGGRVEGKGARPGPMHTCGLHTNLCPPILPVSPSKMFWISTDKEGGLNKIASCF